MIFWPARSGRPVCCRAQNDDRPFPQLAAGTAGRELGISRGSVYYLPRPTSAADLRVVRRIDELHLEFPFAGSRMLRDLLRQEGIAIGRQHVATLMKKMGTSTNLPCHHRLQSSQKKMNHDAGLTARGFSRRPCVQQTPRPSATGSCRLFRRTPIQANCHNVMNNPG